MADEEDEGGGITDLERLGTVAVDTGQVLIIDPCQLFTRSEWAEICRKSDGVPLDAEAGAHANAHNEAILEALAARRGVTPEQMERNATIAGGFGGDGMYKVYGIKNPAGRPPFVGLMVEP